MSYSERTERVLGEEAVACLGRKKIAVVGLGGVGGCCAEALARSGVGRLLLIDHDTVAESNLNRQLFATKDTVGRKKAEAAAERLSLVSDAELCCLDRKITPENAAALIPEDADCIVDAVDDVPAKVALAVLGKERGIPVVCCLGAGNRLDPAGFFVTDIFKTEGDPLARKLRGELRKAGIERLTVVFSRETPVKRPGNGPVGSFAPAVTAAGMNAAAAAIKILLSKETLL